MPNNKLIALVIFVCSFSCLAYEITLTRIFSISLWYHFAFMIISIAMLGIGASGTVLALYPRLKSLSNLGFYALLLGIFVTLSYLASNLIAFDPPKLAWSRLEAAKISLYYISLSLPFFFGGLVVASAFASLSKNAGILYGADLLGAGTGSMAVLCLLLVVPPEKAVFMISSIAFSAVLLIGSARLRLLTLLFLVLNLLLLTLPFDFAALRMSPYKELRTALRYPGAERLNTFYSPFSRIDVFKSPAVRYAPGLSLKYLGPLPEQIGLSVDGSEVTAITAFDGIGTPPFLDYLPSALPYVVGSAQDVLVLDPKGGLQVLVARRFLAKNIYAVESNPLLVRTMKDAYRDFSGALYSNNTLSGLARSWLKGTRQQFDIIDLSLLGVAPSGSLGISEDYRFTIEAFREYLAHLKPRGILSVNLFMMPPPRIELRLAATLTAALKELGIQDPGTYVIAIRSWGSVCIMIKRSPFSAGEVTAVKKFARQKRFDLLYYSGIREQESNVYVRMPSNDYFTAFKSILDHETRERFLDQYLFDVRPVQDGRPFFHYFLKLENVVAIYNLMGQKWQFFIEEGYILPLLFVQVILLGLLLMLAPLVLRKQVERPGMPSAGWFLVYFAMLGMGFMLVEISFIQKLILTLEHPPYAVAALLASILISSGLGSLLSHRVNALGKPWVMIAISVVVVVYGILLPRITDIVTLSPMPVRIISVFCIFLPLGILMGIPFPLGLKRLGQIDESLIPWAWAVNGCFSVLSPVLAVLLALLTGFNAVLWLGASAYLTAFLIFSSAPLRSSEQRSPEQSA